ncbi:hypothetical protein [Paraburkholderia mimosarum]|uniref:hypothetical protein n=1 Tax=Paraburkholderia mimosarum TaxID=312026 RepID=UPI001ADED3E0|nr:hypothetical protein [Paraburkholderia mimosarum]
MIDRLGTPDCHAVVAQELREPVEVFVRLGDYMRRIRAGRNLVSALVMVGVIECKESRIGTWHLRAVRDPHNHLFERIPFVMYVDERHRSSMLFEIEIPYGAQAGAATGVC